MTYGVDGRWVSPNGLSFLALTGFFSVLKASLWLVPMIDGRDRKKSLWLWEGSTCVTVVRAYAIRFLVIYTVSPLLGVLLRAFTERMSQLMMNDPDRYEFDRPL